MPEPEVMKESPEFSPVIGGPLFQLFRRAHLSGDALELMSRRVLIMPLVAWLPLLVLTLLGGDALGGSVKIPFLGDIETHVRFLIALPVLIAAELIVHRNIRTVVQQFVERRIIIEDQVPKFHAAIISAIRVRNSTVLELALLVLAERGCTGTGELVCDAGRDEPQSDICRLLAGLCQRTDLSVHAVSLVSAALDLVLALVAHLEIGLATHAHSPGPGRRVGLSG
jgi:hypothetical protein